MNSLSLSFVLLVVVVAAFSSEEVDVHDEISFHHKLQNYEAELESVLYSFSSNETHTKRNQECIEANKEGPKGVAACMLKLAKVTSTKDKLTLSCFPISQLFDSKPDNFKLEAFECDSFDRRKTCNRQLLKKYRDYFITDEKVCITRNTNQICLGKPSTQKCVRLYDFSVPILPLECNEAKATIVVANNRESLKGFGSCKSNYAPPSTECADPQINYCTNTGCFLKKALKGTIKVEAAVDDKIAKREPIPIEVFSSCFSKDFTSTISLYTGDIDLVEKGCKRDQVNFRITYTCGGGKTPSVIFVKGNSAPVADEGNCISSSDCNSYNCDIKSFIGGTDAPASPSKCGTAKADCTAPDVDFCTPSGCKMDSSLPAKTKFSIVGNPNFGSGDCVLGNFLPSSTTNYFYVRDYNGAACVSTPQKYIYYCARDRKPYTDSMPTSLLSNGVSCLNSLDCSGTVCDGLSADGNGYPTSYGTCTDTGACFTGETRITMSDNSKKIMDDIKVGDKVKGYNGEEGIVIHKVTDPLGSDYIVNINGGEFFFSPDHPFMLPGDITKKQAFRPSTRTGSSESMEVGSFIYKWNDVEGKMETVEIKSLKASERRSPDEEVYALTVWSPSYTGSYIGEGYVSSVGPNLIGLLVKYGLCERVFNSVQSKYEAAYNNYVAKGNSISKFDFSKKLSTQLASQIETIIKTQYPSRIRASNKYVADWKAELENDWKNNFNAEVGNFLEIFTDLSYTFRFLSLYSLKPTDVLPYFATTFTQQIGDLLDNVVVV